MKLLILAVFVLAVCLFPVFTKHMVFRLPSQSALYDCDDAVLATLTKLDALGVSAFPVVGNLGETGEARSEIDHAWVIAEIAGMQIAFDWGEPWLDRQHYEGYPITRGQLLEYVEFDLKEAHYER